MKKINKTILMSMISCATLVPLAYSCSTPSNSESVSSDNKVDNLPIYQDNESLDFSDNDKLNAQLLSSKYSKKLDEKDRREIKDVEERTKQLVSGIKNKSYSKEFLEQELQTVTNKIYSKINERNDNVSKILNSYSVENQRFDVICNQLIEKFFDKRFGTIDRETNKEVQVELYLSQERFLGDIRESTIQRNVFEIRGFWNDLDQFHDLAKVNSFVSFFYNMDLFKSLYYELSVFPYLFFEVNQKDYFSSITNGNTNSFYDISLIELYNVWKNIDLFNRELDFCELSPTTKSSYWYAWFKSIDFADSYKASGIWFVNQHRPIGDKKITNDGTNKFYDTLLPKNINLNNTKEVEAYVIQLLNEMGDFFYKENLEKNPEAKKKIEEYADAVFNRINYIFYESEYTKKYALNFLDLNNNFDEFKNYYNDSLFNKDIYVSSDEELMNANVDFVKASGIRFVGTGSSITGVMTDTDLFNDVQHEKNDYINNGIIDNLKRKINFNDHIRKIDRFKTLYFEFSIFPHLVRILTGMNYDQWTQSHNNDTTNYPYKKWNTNWLMNEYIVYRDWNINMKSRVESFQTNYEELKHLEKTTENSSWFKWINQIDFDTHYATFTGVYPNRSK